MSLYNNFKAFLGFNYVVAASEDGEEVAKAITQERYEDAVEHTPFDESRFVELLNGEWGPLTDSEYDSLDGSILE